ncbi:MAG: tRNA (adenine-N1)-methyltransferase [archaeon]|nr:tRNA (adenine-N1)-methyltransferase [archaeon]
MGNDLIKDQDLVFIICDRRRKWIRKVEAGKEFHTDRGIVKFDEIIGKEFGISIKIEPYNNKFYILKPLPTDIVTKMGRASQIIYPEDIGLILMYTGLGPGSIVVEAGCGSGSLTSIMGNYIRPNGHIYTYDIREKAVKQAKRNIKRVLGEYSKNITVELKDFITEEVKHKEDVDVVILDMATPWLAIPKAFSFLKNSGTICCFSPVIEQVKRNHNALKEAGFFDIHTYELLKREIQVKIKSGYEATRPMGQMVGHTGYLTFARKIDDKFEELLTREEFIHKNKESKEEEILPSFDIFPDE